MASTLSASLGKMSVPAAADGSNGQTLLMPKLQYRFRVFFQNFGGVANPPALTRQVVDITRPSVEFTEIPLEIYNSRVYLAGKPTWQAITVNLRDDANGEISKLVGNQLQQQFDFAEQASAAAGNNYKFTLQFQILDGGNGIDVVKALETWELYGCYISTANYNTLNYGTNEAVTISLTIRYDNAVQLTGDNGVGLGIGEAIGTRAGATVGVLATAPSPQ